MGQGRKAPRPRKIEKDENGEVVVKRRIRKGPEEPVLNIFVILTGFHSDKSQRHLKASASLKMAN